MKVKDHNIIILKADSHFYNKKFDKVIHLLEPEIFSYRENFNFYYMLGISHLYQNDLESADSYLKRANQLDDENISILKGLAIINIKKGKLDEAIKRYLEILDIEPDNKTAKRGLNFIRKNVTLNHTVKMNNLRKLYPVIKMPGKKIKITFIILISLCLLSIPILLLLTKQEKSVRPEIEKLNIPAHKSGIIEYDTENSKNSRYTLTEAEIRDSFAKAKNFFNQYRDNMALIEINRLLNSNASREVKNITLILKDYIKKPDFSTIKDSFSFSLVKKDPLLYNGCYVVWRGKIGNLNISESSILFDLWIGDSNEFEGVAPVMLNFASLLENGQEIEVLGEINYADELLILNGIAIHKILLQ